MHYAIICGFVSLVCFSAWSQTPPPVSTEEETIVEAGTRITYRTVQQTGDGLGEAALSPLEDLNLRRDEIPFIIANIRSPYDPLDDTSCETIAAYVRALDTVLQIDADVALELSTRENEGGSDRDLSEDASDFALGQVASQARSLIPFRGLVRSATGANAHASRVEQAYQNGYLRRAFLKGLGMSQGCSYPAAPLTIDYSSLPSAAAPIRYRAASPE